MVGGLPAGNVLPAPPVDISLPAIVGVPAPAETLEWVAMSTDLQHTGNRHGSFTAFKRSVQRDVAWEGLIKQFLLAVLKEISSVHHPLFLIRKSANG
jgi:hypothetical protein